VQEGATVQAVATVRGDATPWRVRLLMQLRTSDGEEVGCFAT
jgi:hypothetical protein